ncbi:uro-adherence factor A isoform X1 [Cherax quadricarinatus]
MKTNQGGLFDHFTQDATCSSRLTPSLEKYSVVAVRAKVSVEVEQRKRLGTWAKRVLVLDGATLYAYKTKGDGGSVGGWAVGGADVYVARGSDSTRDDGRHILVVSRPPAYKLTFSFNTTYEQARLIQALSSSGATVTGLDAIMLLKDLRKQQEEERKDEERKKQIKEQTGALEERREPNSTSTSLERVAEYAGQDDRKAEEDEEEEDEDEEDLTIKREKNIDDEDEEDEEEPGKNINTIYDISTGVVNNPLYSSNVNLSSSDGESDAPATKETFLFTYSRSSSNSEVPVALLTEVSVTNQRSNENVNPLPKPPRAVFDEPRSSADSQSPSLEDGSPVTVDGSPREVTDNPSEAGDNDNPTEVGSNPSVLDSILAEVSSSFELDSNSVAVCGILAGVDSSPTEVSSGPIVVDGSSAEVDNSSTETDEKQKEQLSFISGKYEDVIFKLEEKECVSSSESLLSSDSFKEVITGENEMVSEAINLLHSNTESSKEGEGLSQVESKPEKHDFQDEFDEKINITIENGKNSDVLSENGLVSGDTFKTEPTEESLNESCAHQPVKMKLERYFYIDCEAPPPDTDSLDLYQRNSCDSHLDSPSSSSSYPSSSGECGSNKEESASEQNKSQVKYEDIINQESKESEIHIKNVIHDVHSDTEKIEQIYNELNNNTQGELQTESYKEHEIPVSPVNEILENIEELGDENSLQVSPDNVMKENGHIEGEDLVDFPIGSHGEQQPLRRVNSIIKKKGSSSSSTGSVKRVQFNLDIKSETPPPSVASEPSVSTAATAEKSDDTRSASARKPESCSDTRTLGSSKSPTSPKARKETSGTTTGSKKMDKKTSSASLGFPSKKKGSSDTTSSSPPSKKTPDSSLTSSAKKKTFEPSSTSSPSKKKGIFSSIFSGSSKRADSLVTREDAETKKKSSETSSVSLKRYQTVDLNAPIIISGQAEVGVSMNRLNSRRVEVRDGHVLSFLPRATTPTSRISLVGLSVAPVLGAAHAHALTLTRAARCMMVIKVRWAG